MNDKEQEQLKFSVKNIGSIQNGEFTQKPLTIFCGPNNSGKTWIMYALHAFYNLAEAEHHFWIREQKKLSKNLTKDQDTVRADQEKSNAARLKKIQGIIQLPFLNQDLNNGLANYFNSPDELFTDAEFKCDHPEAEWINYITNHQQPDVFLIPAERSGLHLFYRELSNRRTALLHHASKRNIDINELLRDVRRSPYARPIADYIDWLNGLTEQKQTPAGFHTEALFLQKQLAQGRYHLNRQTGDVTYKPYTRNSGMPAHILGLHATSSTVKSLFGLWFYLEHQAKAGDILMIDEPELNIHPSNQLLIAHLLARLVNVGIQVVISTHSDYIVREFNNLIMLSEDSNGQLLNSINKQKGIKYEQEAILKPDQVGAYLFDNNEIKPFVHTPKQGFAISTFDEVITSQNNISDQIYHGLQDYGADE